MKEMGEYVGEYKLEECIGKGNFGHVYRAANDDNPPKVVAIKFLPEEMAHDKRRIAALRREAELARDLDHRNLASIIYVHHEEGHLYLVMEYVNGWDLSKLLKERGITIAEKIRIMVETAHGVLNLHRRLIYHGDIKPPNILIGRDGSVKLTDYGLVQAYREESLVSKVVGSFARLFGKKERTFGTPLYMSPEQLDGKKINHLSDIFSFGVTLNHVLTGERPYGLVISAEDYEQETNQQRDMGNLVVAKKVRARQRELFGYVKRMESGEIDKIKLLRSLPRDIHHLARENLKNIIKKSMRLIMGGGYAGMLQVIQDLEGVQRFLK